MTRALHARGRRVGVTVVTPAARAQAAQAEAAGAAWVRFAPFDLLMITGVLLVFALTLVGVVAARLIGSGQPVPEALTAPMSLLGAPSSESDGPPLVLISVDADKAPDSMWADRPDGDADGYRCLRQRGPVRLLRLLRGARPVVRGDRARRG